MYCIYIQFRTNAPAEVSVDGGQMLQASTFEAVLELTDTTRPRPGAHFLHEKDLGYLAAGGARLPGVPGRHRLWTRVVGHARPGLPGQREPDHTVAARRRPCGRAAAL